MPKSWLIYAEEKAGKAIVAVALEVNSVITVAPVFEKKKSANSLEEVRGNG